MEYLLLCTAFIIERRAGINCHLLLLLLLFLCDYCNWLTQWRIKCPCVCVCRLFIEVRNEVALVTPRGQGVTVHMRIGLSSRFYLQIQINTRTYKQTYLDNLRDHKIFLSTCTCAFP